MAILISILALIVACAAIWHGLIIRAELEAQLDAFDRALKDHTGRQR